MLTQKQLELINQFNITVQSVEDSLIAITPVDLEKTVKEESDLEFAYDYPKYFSNGLPATTLEGDNSTSFAEILVDENVWLTDIAFDDLEHNLKQLLASLLVDKTLKDTGYKVKTTLRDGKECEAQLIRIGEPSWVKVLADGNLILPYNYATLVLESPEGGSIEKDNQHVDEFYADLCQKALEIEPKLFEVI